MAFREYAHNFGALTASTENVFNLPTGYGPSTFRGSADVRASSEIKYAIIRNSSGGAVTVLASRGASVVGIGERKRIEFPAGTKWFTVNPAATVTAGDLTADVGVDGVTI